MSSNVTGKQSIESSDSFLFPISSSKCLIFLAGVLVQQNMPNSNLFCFLPSSHFSTICNNFTLYQVKSALCFKKIPKEKKKKLPDNIVFYIISLLLSK